ncbi:MAG TPA: S9 family peptidase [Ktedonobacterales bacterium]|nr:S9 family peptidase [Ktedonobacterales bacterium]
MSQTTAPAETASSPETTESPSSSARRQLTPEDLYALRLVEDPRLSPDGATVVYVLQEMDRASYEYRHSLWLIATDAKTPARRFTAGPNDSHARWSPDGKTIAFLRAPGTGVKPKNAAERERGVGRAQIWVIPVDGGEARQLTWLRYGAGEPVWSPDGKAIAFSAQTGQPDDPEVDDAALEGRDLPRVRTIDRLAHKLDSVGYTYELRSHLFVVAADEEHPRPRQLTEGDWDDGSPAWSPDGARIAFTSDRSEQRWRWPAASVWALDLATEALTRLSDEAYGASSPSWSPDGREIAFLVSPRRHGVGHTDLCVAPADPAEGKLRLLTQDFVPSCSDTCIDDLRGSHGAPQLVWSADGQEIFFLASMRGTTHVYAARVSGDWLPRRVTDGPRRVYAFSLNHATTTLALGVSDPADPGDLYAQPVVRKESALSEVEPLRLTRLNEALLAEVALGSVEEFAFRGADDWELQGWIMRPSMPVSAGQNGATPHAVPTILEIHGGPAAMYGYSFFMEFQLLAAQGYAVVYMNPRGSTGYGRIFSGAVINDWGGKDYEDLLLGLDAALARSVPGARLDGARLGVAGGSYGGFMTNWAVGHSDRFKAAVTMRSVVNIAPFFGTSDIGWWFEDEIGVIPWRDPERARHFSPLTYVENIHTPLLILHSDQDLRCPVSEGEQLFTALKYLGRETKFMRFEGQSHELSRAGHPRSRVIRLRAILDWFQRYLPANSPNEG